MQYRTLGRTGLKVSIASLGTGGPSRLGQNTHRDEAQSQRVIRRALELGINLIDTAAAYGDSEAILGRALEGVPRASYILASKFTPDPGENAQIITPQVLVESCERSLRRLKTDVIDIFQFHGLVPDNYRAAVDRLYDAAAKLKEAGKVRFLGVTEYFFRDPDHQMLRTALDGDRWDTIMVKYGIMNLSAERDVLPLARKRNVGVINMSAVRVKMTQPKELEKTIARWKDAGLLAPDAVPAKGPLDFLIHDEVPSVVAAGYKFGIAHPAIATLLVGTGNVAHLEENVATLLGSPLPEADCQRIRQLCGHLAESEGDTA